VQNYTFIQTALVSFSFHFFSGAYPLFVAISEKTGGFSLPSGLKKTVKITNFETVIFIL
jgi:hypothetical protein